jgi:hypothetical protein
MPLRVDESRVQQKLIRVAHDNRTTQSAQAMEDLPRMGTEASHVSQTDDVLDLLAFDLCQHSVQRDEVALSVGNNSNAHGTPPQCRLL